MEELTTKRLNDQIVFMRKEVKRAIVHQIHRLTTAAKRLRNKKGTEEQKQKNAIKADNMVAEMSILKKMKPDDVSVFGLTNFEEVEVKNFLSKRVIAPETKAMAKLCLRKNMRSVIDDFIKEIGSAHSRLLELLDERQQHKEKKEKKKLKKQENNEELNHAYDDTSDSTLDSSDESIPDLVLAKYDSDDTENEKLNSLGNNENDSVRKIVNVDINLDITHKAKKKPVQEGKNDRKSSASSSDNEFIQPDDKKTNSDINVKNTNSDINVKKTNSDINVKKTNSDINVKKTNSNINKEDRHKEVDTIENKPLERKNVDPFFITRDNSEYRTYCDIGANAKREKDSDKIDLSDDDKNFKNNYKKGNFNKKNHSKDDSFKRNKNSQRFDSRKTITYLGGSDRKAFDKKGFQKGEKRPLSAEPPSNVKLHPSWEAKKKLSATAIPFQGKKITFDDD